MPTRRELEAIFLRRSEEQLAEYGPARMREEANIAQRRGKRAANPLNVEAPDMVVRSRSLEEQSKAVREERERKDRIVLSMFKQGASDQEIADRLSVSARTVVSLRERLKLRRRK